jgi:peptidoglycan biosynthesis protein MviN/MurJ (putative lipid II flippase)
MNDVKTPMSNSYKAIFIFSIFMIFFVIIMGAASGSKGGGFGVFVWGYTAYLMYKRNNKNLISLYKTLIWIQVILLSATAAIFIFGESEIFPTVELGGFFVLAAIAMGVSYGLYKFFQRQNEIN